MDVDDAEGRTEHLFVALPVRFFTKVLGSTPIPGAIVKERTIARGEKKSFS
jgi:hypothetical protein